MAKQLLLLRHGKSDWNADYGNDHQRPLAPRGIKAACEMGSQLASAGQAPDLVVSSTAVRAQLTAELAAEAGEWDCNIATSRSLYHGGISALREIVLALPEDHQRVMLVGHQPTWSEFLSALIGGGDIRFPTAAAARVDLPAYRWSDLQFGSGELVWLLPPKFFQGKLRNR